MSKAKLGSAFRGIATVLVIAFIVYAALGELEERGFLTLPSAERAPTAETAADALSAVIGDQDESCLENDIDVLSGYWRWLTQFSRLEEISVQRAGANEFIYLAAQHRIALIDLAPTHGCTGAFKSLDDMASRYIDYITDFRQSEDTSSSFSAYLEAARVATQNLRDAIASVPTGA